MSLSSAIAQHWLVPSLPHLVKRHPQLGLDLLVEDGLVDLARSGVDIAIRTGDPTTLSLVARKLGEIETGLKPAPRTSMAVTHPAAQKT